MAFAMVNPVETPHHPSTMRPSFIGAGLLLRLALMSVRRQSPSVLPRAMEQRPCMQPAEVMSLCLACLESRLQDSLEESRPPPQLDAAVVVMHSELDVLPI